METLGLNDINSIKFEYNNGKCKLSINDVGEDQLSQYFKSLMEEVLREQIKYAHWNYNEIFAGYAQCSNCGHYTGRTDEDRHYSPYKYCSNCGAKMEAKEE